MQTPGIIDRYTEMRSLFFAWRYSLVPARKILLAFGMACITGLLAQVHIYIPFTPVPITGQVLAVLLSGVICGGVYGSISQILYVGLGIAGIPWFAGGGFGTIYIAHTGGYLIGFIVAPLVIGSYTDNYIRNRTFFYQLKYMLLGVGIIYIFGSIILAFSMRTGIGETILKGIIPFVFVDLIKASCAAGISCFILPKSSYNKEKDKTRYLFHNVK